MAPIAVDAAAARRHPLARTGPVLGLLLGWLGVLAIAGLVRSLVSADLLLAPEHGPAGPAAIDFLLSLALFAVTALGLAGAPSFPIAVVVMAAAGAAAVAGTALLTPPGPTVFQLLCLTLLPFGPYALRSRRLRLIYRRVLGVADLAPLADLPVLPPPAARTLPLYRPPPVLPAPVGADGAEPELPLVRSGTVRALLRSVRDQVIAASAEPIVRPDPEPPTGRPSIAGRRQGLESLTNLKPGPRDGEPARHKPAAE